MTAAPPVEGAAALAPVGGTADTRITLSLTNVPLIEALRYLTELAGLRYKIEPYAVSIVPITENTTDLVTKKYRVPPGFIPAAPSGGHGNRPVTGSATQRSHGEPYRKPHECAGVFAVPRCQFPERRLRSICPGQ